MGFVFDLYLRRERCRLNEESRRAEYIVAAINLAEVTAGGKIPGESIVRDYTSARQNYMIAKAQRNVAEKEGR